MLRIISAQIDPGVDIYELRKDGRLFLVGSENECYRNLQQSQSQSFEWAMKYEGWTITPKGSDWRDSYNFYHKDVPG